MKLVKSLLLGSAAGFVAVAGASAADLPSRKAAPAEYVRVCSAYGAGFFYIPGSDVCLKVGGLARFQYAYTEPAANNASPTGFRGFGRLELDARNPTAYGTLRAFVRLDFAYRTGAERSGSGTRAAYTIDGTAAADSGINGRAQTHVIVDKAFVQWGGLVAGRTNSLFAYNKAAEIIALIPTDALWGTNLVGYIATFGSGFYASLSLEDAISRRQGLSNALGPVVANGGVVPAVITATGPTAAPAFLPVPGQGALAGDNLTVAYYGGFRMPDVVAAIGVEQSWGGAQLSAALHQIPVVGTTGAGLGVGAGLTPANGGLINPSVSSKYGWAVAGSVQINLPMLAPGDYIWLNAAYADGAVSYIGSNWYGAHLNNQQVKNSHAYWAADAYYIPGTTSVQTSKSWAINGSFVHYWMPTFRSHLTAGYQQFNNPGIIRDWNYWAVVFGTYWTPVRGLDIGGDVGYQRITGKGGGTIVNNINNTNQITKNSDGAWLARVRITRTF